jgi:hypothetical protein
MEAEYPANEQMSRNSVRAVYLTFQVTLPGA